MTKTKRRSIWLGTLAMVATVCVAPLSIAQPAGALPPGPPSDGYVLLGGDGGIFPWNVPFAGAPA